MSLISPSLRHGLQAGIFRLMKFDLTAILALLRAIIPVLGEQAHSQAQRAFTIPRAQHDKLCAGMSADDKAVALTLRDKAADALADYAVYVASRGEIDPD